MTRSPARHARHRRVGRGTQRQQAHQIDDDPTSPRNALTVHVVKGGDGVAGPDEACGGIIHRSEHRDEPMIVQVAAKLIIANAAGQEQPWSLDRTGGHHDDRTRHSELDWTRRCGCHECHAGRAHPVSDVDDLGVEEHIAIARSDGTGDEGVVRTVFGVDRARVSDALRAPNARRPAVVRNAVDG